VRAARAHVRGVDHGGHAALLRLRRLFMPRLDGNEHRGCVCGFGAGVPSRAQLNPRMPRESLGTGIGDINSFTGRPSGCSLAPSD